MTYVLVLNADYTPTNICTVKRAVVLLMKEKAEALEHDDVSLRSETMTLARPAVIRLVAYVRIPYAHRKRITRRAVFARDDHRCQYCLTSAANLTVDHVVPKSKGGKTEWTNIVSACHPCNARKGDALPRDAGMKLRRKPKAPRPDVFVYVAVRVPPVAWVPYLPS